MFLNEQNVDWPWWPQLQLCTTAKGCPCTCHINYTKDMILFICIYPSIKKMKYLDCYHTTEVSSPQRILFLEHDHCAQYVTMWPLIWEGQTVCTSSMRTMFTSSPRFWTGPSWRPFSSANGDCVMMMNIVEMIMSHRDWNLLRCPLAQCRLIEAVVGNTGGGQLFLINQDEARKVTA